MQPAQRGWIFWIAAALFVAAAAVATFSIKNEYPFFAGYVILQFIVLATAWNILGGYAGYVNFGTSAFFGLGVYTAVFLFKATGAPLLVQIAAAAGVGALLGFLVGLLTLRMRGIFFSIATIALTIIIETFIINWKFVGGATGMPMIRPPAMPPFDSYIKMLFVNGAVMVVIAVALARFIQGSWIGRGLRALRDDELAAACSGVPTLKLKLTGLRHLRRPDVRGRRAERHVPVLCRSDVRVQPELLRVGPCHGADRRHRALDRAGPGCAAAQRPPSSS